MTSYLSLFTIANTSSTQLRIKRSSFHKTFKLKKLDLNVSNNQFKSEYDDAFEIRFKPVKKMKKNSIHINLINNSTTESRKNFNNTMESDIVINDPSVDSLNSIDKSTFCLTTINKTKLGDIFLNELSSNNGSSIFYFYSLFL